MPPGRVCQELFQPGLPLLDVASERDPGQRLARQTQDVERQGPVALPRLLGQRPTEPRQAVEIATFLSLADLALDSALPESELATLGSWARCARVERSSGHTTPRLLEVSTVRHPALMASPRTSTSRVSWSSVLMSGGARQMVLLTRRGIWPRSTQRSTTRVAKPRAPSYKAGPRCARSTSSTAAIIPSPRTWPTAGRDSSWRVSSAWNQEPTDAARSTRPSRSMIARLARPTAQQAA